MDKRSTSIVGIMSMQRIVNYGSFLQAYALKRIIESLGLDVIFVDYRVEKPIVSNKAEMMLDLAAVMDERQIPALVSHHQLV